MRLSVSEIEQVVGVRRPSPAALFFDKTGAEQFGKCPSKLTVIAVSESRVEALGLEAAFPPQVSQGDGEG